VDVLCNADLLTEGWDETRASVVMHLAPTTSERVFVQRLGRVMRPAPGKEAVSVEFLPAGDPMGVQTAHEVFGQGWYKPLGRVAGPPTDTGERGKLAEAARVLAEAEGDKATLVNPSAAPQAIIAGLKDGGWRHADPGLLPPIVMEEWVEEAAKEATIADVIEVLGKGIPPEAGNAWWALSGVLSRRARDGSDQPMWRAWATALLTQPDLIDHLPVGTARAVLDRLRMSGRERLRALWWHADQAGRWDRLAALEQLGRSSDRRRRWAALDEASSWAPAWAWDVSRSLADGNRPGRNQELGRIAAWEARHLIANGGELALIANWMRAAGEPPPEPAPPDGQPPLRLGQAARLILMLGPGDVPARPEHLRMTSRAAAAAGGWAKLRGFLDTLDFGTADARRALRAAVGALQPKALGGRRAWNALRSRAPRLPDAVAAGVGEPQGGGGEDGAPSPRSRRRRRRRLRATMAATGAASPQPAAAGQETSDGADGAVPAEGASPPAPRRRRRRRRRPGRPAGEANGAVTVAPPPAADHNGPPPAAQPD